MKKMVLFVTLVLAFALNLHNAFSQDGNSTAPPPLAKKIARTFTLHGETLKDDYFWLREKTNPEVIAYLEAENAYTDAVMKPTVEFQEKLYQEMLGRIKETDLTVPYRMGAHFYYSRTEKGRQYRMKRRMNASMYFQRHRGTKPISSSTHSA